MVAKSKSGAIAETKQVSKFGIVGILNTLIDFGLFNVFINLGLYRIIANLFSTSVAMTFSFIANKTFVFGSKQRDLVRQAALFIMITAVGLYVIQNLVIYLLTETWTSPLQLAYEIVKLIGLDQSLSEQFVINNGAKAVATLFSLTWNYLLYKRFVFKR